MKAFATIQELTRANNTITVKCDDGNTYTHEADDFLDDLVIGDWITIKDWELSEQKVQVQGISSAYDIMIVSCNDGNRYFHEYADVTDNMKVGDYIKKDEWSLFEG